MTDEVMEKVRLIAGSRSAARMVGVRWKRYERWVAEALRMVKAREKLHGRVKTVVNLVARACRLE